ncbi:MAG: oligopeptide ABC transporter ATP-binding protein, partial [Thermoplasmata archaeon]
LGKLMEEGKKDEIINNPLHPYTRALMDAIPTLGKKEKEVNIKGEIPNPMEIPTGCRFHPRCPYAFEKCRKEEPELLNIKGDHWVACHRYSK